jgi:small ligand-binding sensory domain FIST
MSAGIPDPAEMDRFISAHAQAENWAAAVDGCVAQLGAGAADANFGFVYATDTLADDMTRIVGRLPRATGVRDWVGTVGIGICAPGREYYEAPALSLMFCRFPEHSYRIFCMDGQGNGPGLAHSAEWMDSRRVPLAIVHGDPNSPQLPGLLNSLLGRMNDGFLTGGLSSSRGRHVQVAGVVTPGPLSGVLLSDEVAASVRLSQGCSPIGARHTITMCENEYIVALDERPALDVLKEDVGDVLAQDIRRIGGYIFAGLPIRGTDTGDYLVRHITGFDPSHGVIAIADQVETGDQLIFCRRDPQTAYDDLVGMLRNMRTDKPPRGAVYFSCTGRGAAQFGPDSRELRTIADVLGDVPLTGFFCSGEIYHCRLYGYTGVLTLFS